jgi:PIN domain nuclease of toxin-antitoxin system
VRLLIDTHTLLWAYWGDPLLSVNAARLLCDPLNEILVSPASHWEIAIKMMKGKLTLREQFLDFVQHAIIDNGFKFLPIEPKHTAIVAVLRPHHKDPFDRMLVAQALAEGISMLSADAVLDAYGVQRLW